MHSEPSKAAMERVDALFKEWGSHGYRIGLARYIDTVDRVARETLQLVTDLEMDGGPVAEGLRSLMLPDEPDAKAVLATVLGPLLVHKAVTALAAAGYTITKEPTP